MFRIAASTLCLALVCCASFLPAQAGDTLPIIASSMRPLMSAPEPGHAIVRQASLSPDIPGVTYPRAAPPDLVADVAAAPEVDFPDAIARGVEAAAAPAPTAPAPITTTLKLTVDLATQRLTVVEHGEVKHLWPISSGRAGYATKIGTFRPQWASRLWHSRQYDFAPMPHAVFFNGGIAFHATQATHLLGRPASHGCVRLAPQNAKALFAMIHSHGFKATEITVTGPAAEANGANVRPTVDRSKPGRVSQVSRGKPPGGLLWDLF
jgi:lipoprotein-anchoring transpeptidase ErfK/SrfK